MLRLLYNPSFNFHASDGPRQGKMSIGGTMAQIAAGVMGGIAPRNNDRTMMGSAPYFIVLIRSCIK